ncbi:hypothetical protein Emed_004745 [Eimeria media]
MGVHLEADFSKEPLYKAFVKEAAGFAQLAELYLEARRRRGTVKPASSSAFRLPGQRIIQFLLLMLVLVHCISLLSLLKSTIAEVSQSQKHSVGASLPGKSGAELDEEEKQHSPEELSLALAIDDEHMDKYERRLGRAARLLKKAWLEADSQTQQIFVRLFTPGRDLAWLLTPGKAVAGALNPFLQLEQTARSFKRPTLADFKDTEEQHRSREGAEGVDDHRNSNAHRGVADIEGTGKVPDGLKQVPDRSEDKARADAKGQGTSREHKLAGVKGATVRDKFESYVRFVIALNRLKSPNRGADESFEQSEDESESADEGDDEESGDEYDLRDAEALDSLEASKGYTNQAGAHEATGAEDEAGVEGQSKRTEEAHADEELDKMNAKHEFRPRMKASEEDERAREAESEGEATDLKPGERAARAAERVKQRLVREVNQSRRVYAARLKLVTALLKAARRRIEAIGVSLSFADQHRVSSPLYGLRGHPMPFLDKLKKRPRHPAGYSRLYEQLQDRMFPAPESSNPDVANVPSELIDRLANAVKLSDLLIEQDQGVAASFNQFLRVVRTNEKYDEEDTADLEHLSAGSRLSMDPEGRVEFPVALFRAVVGNLKALHELSFITDDLIGDWSENWTIDNIWAQTYKLCDAERERTAALYRIKQSLRNFWSGAQGKAVANDDVFLLALYLL